MNKSALSLNIGEAFTLIATISPDDATDKTITWSTSDASIATVDANGLVTAKTAGTAIITAKTEDGGKTATCEVTVTIPIESISFNTGILEFAAPGAAAQTIRATLTPADATGELLWESYDESVATVDESGSVTPHGVGISLITCEAVDSDSFAYDECLAIVHAAKPLRLPAMLKTIEREAFRGIDAQEIYIPKGVKTIGAYAFADCESLRIVHIPATVDAISSSAFNGCEDIKFITEAYGESTDFAEAHEIEYFIFVED